MLSIKQRESTIKKIPLFMLLNKQELHKLALLTDELVIAAGVPIVEQDKIVDSFYLIQSGTAQVIKTITSIDGIKDIVVGELSQNDVIGINHTGFFSADGITKATVVAKTTIVLLRVEIRKFNIFLSQPQNAYPALKNTSEKIVLMHFLKNLFLFSYLSNQNILRLAHHVKKLCVKAGEHVFYEGDSADACYFLLKGSVSICIKLGVQEKVIKILEPIAMIGESAFLHAGTRNASLVTVTDTEFLIIYKEDFFNIVGKDSDIFEKIKLSRIQQLRPKLKDDVILVPTEIDPPEKNIKKSFLLLKKTSGKKISISEDEVEIWQKMDGINDLKAIHSYAKNMSFEDACEFVFYLHSMDFIDLDFFDAHNTEPSFFTQLISSLKELII